MRDGYDRVVGGDDLNGAEAQLADLAVVVADPDPIVRDQSPEIVLACRNHAGTREELPLSPFPAAATGGGALAVLP